jgi:SAM-dependent methyltransferase
MSELVEKIEILPVTNLNQHRQLVISLNQMASRLSLELGWHYLLDLTWIISQLGTITQKNIMDAGAGTGILQWYLAQNGATVLSVDRANRVDLPLRFRWGYRVKGLRSADLLPLNQVVRTYLIPGNQGYRKISRLLRDLVKVGFPQNHTGSIILYNHDLKDLVDIESDSLDAVVAVSSLEHNSPAELGLVVDELIRVIKPGGVLLATLGAARDQDWFHVPSKGWNYSVVSLRNAFRLSNDVRDNYDQYDKLFTALVKCDELRTHLASFYSHSGENGMPWGKWNPQYQPVGVCKKKPV